MLTHARMPTRLPACPPHLQGAAEAVVVFVLAYATAYGETLTIAHFPYYTFQVCAPGVQGAGGSRVW